MYLGADVLDKQLLDRDGRKAGKVDDLVLELRPGERPTISALVTGHGAMLHLLPSFLARLVRRLEAHVAGVPDAEPFVIGWEHVTKIDVTVHIDLERED